MKKVKVQVLVDEAALTVFQALADAAGITLSKAMGDMLNQSAPAMRKITPAIRAARLLRTTPARLDPKFVLDGKDGFADF